MKQKLLSGFSFLLFAALLIPLVFSDSRIGTMLFDRLFALGFYTPLFIAAAGFIAAWFGIRNVYRMLLTCGHGILFTLYAALLFIAKFGFQEP